MIALGRFFLLLSLGFALANCGELRAGYVIDPAQPLQSQRFQLEYQGETSPISGTRSDSWVLIPSSSSTKETPLAPSPPKPSVELPPQGVIAQGGMSSSDAPVQGSGSAGSSGLSNSRSQPLGGNLVSHLFVEGCCALPALLLDGILRPPREKFAT